MAEAPAPNMATVNQTFQSAPIGRRVFFSMIFAVGVLVIIFAVNLYVAFHKITHAPVSARFIQGLVPLVPIFILLVTFLFERSKIAQFSIEDNVLVLGKKRHPLVGLVEVAKDPKVLRRAIKKFGNGGIGSIRGKFWSKRLGTFEAFLTDTENAVLLRWPDKLVAVSPADSEFFIYSARAAAGLK
jgi:hypothetical protein